MKPVEDGDGSLSLILAGVGEGMLQWAMIEHGKRAINTPPMKFCLACTVFFLTAWKSSGERTTSLPRMR
jgi:hypothetical protein